MTDRNQLKIQLRDILNVDLLQDAEVLAGERGLSNSIVSVNVMEVPDIIDWVRPGEFLLTTAYTFSDDIEMFEALIPKLKAKRVCGMGIKTQRYISEVPERVLRVADEIDFPIIRIPQSVQYGDLIKEIFNHIIGEQTRLLSRINDFNSTVRDIMLRHGGMQAVAEQIYLALDAPVVIRDDIFRDVYLYCPDPDAEALIADDYREIAKMEPQTTHMFLGDRRREARVGEHGIHRFTIPIFFDNTHYGSIYIWDTKESIRSQDLFVIESASSLIALDILNRITLVERENVHQTTFLEQLLSDDAAEQDRAIENADYYLYHPEKPSQIVVLDVEDKGSRLQMTPNNARMIKNLNTGLLNLTNRLRQEYGGYFLSTRKSDRAIFLLQYEKNSTAEERGAMCQRFINILLRNTQQAETLPVPHIGVGSCVESHRQLQASLQQAEQAVRILQSRGDTEQSVLHYDDLGLLRVLGHPLLRDDALAYANEVLADLEAHDSTQRGDLLDTVRVYFEAGGNLKRVSEIMFTHYNTVIYRINRIRDMYGIDLRDPETAFNLQLALKIKELIQ
ncbi:MAG: PucR family transcriptional regulator [Saccharofermentanales bacterium]